jgi:hypothetical protein
MTSARTAAALVVVALASAIALQSSFASPPSADEVKARPLAQLALSASQVGPGYRAWVIPGGRKVEGQVTLDLCGFRYLSDELRAARLQLAYDHPRSALALSNEVVRYRGRGAELAYGELAYAATRCPRNPTRSPVRGVGLLSWRLTRIDDPRLLPRSLAFVARVSGTRDGKRFVRSGLFVYQIHGDLLSAVYTNGGSVTAQKRFGLRAAALSASNLRRS